MTFQSSFFRLLLVALTLNFFHVTLSAQQIERVEPPNWWVGMTDPNLQIMLYGENIGQATFEIENEDVILKKVNKATNPNYVFIDLEIAMGAAPQSVKIHYQKGKAKSKSISYELRAKTTGVINPVDQSDVVYLITPDRFANGDPSNDSVAGMKEGLDRSFHSGRHGGDLAGIISHLDYLDDLGVTTLWLNPVLENDMPSYSYHGYAITDYYKVDPRFGSNQQFRQLSDELHARGMKHVMDMVFNHCGLSHWWMQDPPFEGWVHDLDKYGYTNHGKAVYSDTYGAMSDLESIEKGWFVPSMPDLNHDNAFMANYLIQNSIWWIEYLQLDGIRMDTHPYNKAEVMQGWAERVLAEYPGFYLLGETWVDEIPIEAHWAKREDQSEGFNSGLTSITDFPLCFAAHRAFSDGGDVYKLYATLAQDFLYDEPFSNTIFLDNHDMDRFFHTIGNDLGDYKLAMTFLLTTRGIPQLYYGMEILMNKYGEHGDLREDFPGGWADDSYNAFDYDQLSADQQEAFDYLRTLLQIRKESKAIQRGAYRHFVPYENVYVYVRQWEEEQLLVILNNADDEVTLELSRFEEVINQSQEGVDLLTEVSYSLDDSLTLDANTALVLKMSNINN